MSTLEKVSTSLLAEKNGRISLNKKKVCKKIKAKRTGENRQGCLSWEAAVSITVN